tara:strand:+ start:4106 stop:4978 length:873 start_codon:yes stop_codon:yes gene_type:complete
MNDLVTQAMEHFDAVEHSVETKAIAPPQTNLSPQERIKQNSELIQALAPEIKKNHLANINGKQFMCVGGGIAIANAQGFKISVGKVHFDKEDGVWWAQADMTDGNITVNAIGYVGDDEKRWTGTTKAARNSMVQTRAEAKLCRSNFGHMYTLYGADSATPAEEMMGVEDAGNQPHTTATTPTRREPTYDPVEGVKPTRKAANADGVLETTIIVTDVQHKAGSTNGNDWQLWLVVSSSGDNYGTFDEKVATSARTMMNSEEHDGVRIKYTETTNAKGYKQLRIQEWDCIPF